MRFVRRGAPYPKDRLVINVNDSSLSAHSINFMDNFIDRSLEGEETFLPERDTVLSTLMLLQLE